MRRSRLALGVAVPLALALAFVAGLRGPKNGDPGATTTAPLDAPATLAKPASKLEEPEAPAGDPRDGLDLGKMAVGDDGVTAPVADPKKTARLNLDPVLQRVAERVMTQHHLPEASVVLMEVATGNVLVYASHVEKGPWRDLAVEATAPAASVFKVVTGSSLVENAGLSPDQRECYSGGEQRLRERDLVADPRKDRWCTTLKGAMGRSINTVFARLASSHLKPAVLEETARSLGFGAPLAFDRPVQASALHFPEDSLGFARTAAGFWNTTLSPLHAAWLSATVARGGETVTPHLVASVVDDKGAAVWTASAGARRHAIKPATARAVTAMMDETVAEGTSYKAFHDGKGQAFLGGVTIAGKTGTLTDAGRQRFYTWFTGFSHGPSRAEDGPRKDLAIGVLVVNSPVWTIKANVLAREVLRAAFAQQKEPGVTMPLQGGARSPAVANAGAKKKRRSGK